MLTLSDLNDTRIIDDTFVYKGSGIHFRSLGRGVPLIFIHGFGASMDTWRLLEKDLGNEFRLVFLDLRGHGYSARPPDSRYSIQDQTDAVFGLMEHLGIRSAVLVGHSLGFGRGADGGIERAFQAYSFGIEACFACRVGISGAGAFFWTVVEHAVYRLACDEIDTSEFHNRMALRHAFHDHAKITDSLIELYAKYQRIPGTIHALMWTVRNLIAADIDFVRRSLRQIQIPVLNILGQHDRIVPRWTAEALRNLLPQYRLEIIDGVGHVPQEESPEAVIQLIRKFVLAPYDSADRRFKMV